MACAVDTTLIHIFINMRHYLFILITLLLTSCSSLQFRYGALTAVSHYDGIYYNKNSKVERINNNWDFQQKLRTDFNFINDFSWYAQNQDLNLYYTNYNYLGGWRSGLSPFDLWWNGNDIWWNWSMNYPFTFWGSFRTRDILGFGWGWNHWNRWGNTYNWRWNRWNYNTPIVIPRPNRNYVRVKGRRGSSNTQIRQPRTNTTSVDRVIRRVNEGRRIIPTTNSTNRVYQRPQRRIQSPTTRTRTQIRTPQRTRSNNPSSRNQVRVNSGRRSIKQ